MANSNFNAQGAPVAGGYVQPAAGITGALVCLTDTSGNAIKTTGAASSVGYMGASQYRDSTVTAQVTSTASAPTAATVVATVTPGTAGLWEITGYIAITGTTVAATDTNNMGLYQTATARYSPIPILIASTTGNGNTWPIPAIVLNLSAVDTVNVKAIANATGSSVYLASLVCRLVG